MPNKLKQGAPAHLDVSAIVAFFGGSRELARSFEKHRINELTPYAVEQWMKRRYIPLKRRLDLERLAEVRSLKFSFETYARATPRPIQRRKRRKAA